MKKNKKSILDNEKFIKLLRFLGIIVSVIIIVFSFLQLFDVMEHGDYVFIPGLAVLMFIQALENWKKNRKQGMFSLGVGIFITAVFIFNVIMNIIRGI